MLSDNDGAVNQNLTTVDILLYFKSAPRKEFWSVRRLVCYNTQHPNCVWAQDPIQNAEDLKTMC